VLFKEKREGTRETSLSIYEYARHCSSTPPFFPPSLPLSRLTNKIPERQQRQPARVQREDLAHGGRDGGQGARSEGGEGAGEGGLLGIGVTEGEREEGEGEGKVS